jgi:hypothetical protein
MKPFFIINPKLEGIFMKARFILFAFAAVLLIGLSSCFLAPELAINYSFTLKDSFGADILDPANIPETSYTHQVTIYYSISNVCATDLTNCKLEFQINRSDLQQPTIWTSGHDIGKYSIIPATGAYTYDAGSAYVDSIYLIGSGFDNPPDNNSNN